MYVCIYTNVCVYVYIYICKIFDSLQSLDLYSRGSGIGVLRFRRAPVSSTLTRAQGWQTTHLVGSSFQGSDLTPTPTTLMRSTCPVSGSGEDSQMISSWRGSSSSIKAGSLDPEASSAITLEG